MKVKNSYIKLEILLFINLMIFILFLTQIALKF